MLSSRCTITGLDGSPSRIYRAPPLRQNYISCGLTRRVKIHDVHRPLTAVLGQRERAPSSTVRIFDSFCLGLPFGRFAVAISRSSTDRDQDGDLEFSPRGKAHNVIMVSNFRRAIRSLSTSVPRKSSGGFVAVVGKGVDRI